MRKILFGTVFASTLAFVLVACGVDGNLAYLLAGEPNALADVPDGGDAIMADGMASSDAADAFDAFQDVADAPAPDTLDGALLADAADASSDADLDAADGADVADGEDIVLPPFDLVLPDMVALDIVDAPTMPDTPDVVATVDRPDVVAVPDIIDAGSPADHVDVVMVSDRPDIVAAPDIIDVPMAMDIVDVPARPDIVDAPTMPDTPDVVATVDRPDVVAAPDIIDAGLPADHVDVVTAPDIVDVPPAPPTVEGWYTPSLNGQLVPSSGRAPELAVGRWNGNDWYWVNYEAPAAGEGYYRRLPAFVPTPTELAHGEVAFSLYGGCGQGQPIGTCPPNWADFWRVYWNGRSYTSADRIGGQPAIRIGDPVRCDAYRFPTGCVVFRIPPT